MIKISVAGLCIEVHNKYKFIEELAKDYITDSEHTDFSVFATEEEIEEERRISEYPFKNDYLESIVTYRKIAEVIPRYDAIVFHGAVIVKGDMAFAVTARSGVGKTTHIRLWHKVFDDVHVLNGDKPILRIIDGEVYACGTPWRGKEGYGRNEMMRLRGIGFIERAEDNLAEPVGVSDALMKFVGQIYVPKDPVSAARALSVANGVITGVPMIKICANMQNDAATVAHQAFLKSIK